MAQYKGGLTDAQTALWDGVVQVWTEQSTQNIKIKELTAVSHVARSTFYVYYDSIEDLITEMEDFHLRNITKLNKDVGESPDRPMGFAFYKNTLVCLEENLPLFQAWFASYPNYHFIEGWKNAIKAHLRTRFSKVPAVPHDEGLLFETAASAILGAYTYWIKNPEEVDTAFFDRLMRTILEGIA